MCTDVQYVHIYTAYMQSANDHLGIVPIYMYYMYISTDL